MRALLTAVIVLAVGLGMCPVIHAESYGASVEASQVGPDAHTWTYTVYNTSTLDAYVLWVFTIEVDDLCDIYNTVTPTGWSADTTSAPHFITWMYQTDTLPAGGSCAGFQATFTTVPQKQEFTALLINNDDQTCPYIEGNVTILAHPEPAGLLVLATGLGPLFAFRLRRRGRI